MSYQPHRSSYHQSPPTPSYPTHHPSSSYSASTPPPPPPKPPSHSPSRRSTPQTGPPLPLPPQDGSIYVSSEQQTRYPLPPSDPPATPHPPPNIDDGWLLDILKDKSLRDLQTLLTQPTLLTALSQTHPSYPSSLHPIQNQLTTNAQLSQHLLALAATLETLRTRTSIHLLHLHALERQWRLTQSRLDDALAPFSPKALHARLVQSIGEQELLLRGMEESFLEGEGKAGEREVEGFVKRWREGRKVLERRREGRARWEEGRVGGWR